MRWPWKKPPLAPIEVDSENPQSPEMLAGLAPAPENATNEELHAQTLRLEQRASDAEQLLKLSDFMNQKCEAGLMTEKEREEVLRVTRGVQGGDYWEKLLAATRKILELHPEFREELRTLNNAGLSR